MHRELCERVYIPLRNWLVPLKRIDSLLSNLNNYGTQEWESYKNHANYLIFQLDKYYENSVTDLNRRLDEYRKDHDFLQKRLNDLIIDRFSKWLDQSLRKYTIEAVIVSGNELYKDVRDIVIEDTVVTAAPRDTTKKLTIHWQTDRNIRKIQIGDKPDPEYVEIDYDEFISTIQEIAKTVEKDESLSFLINLLRKVMTGSSKLVNLLTVELGKNDREIAEKYGIDKCGIS